MSVFWFELTSEIVPNHVISAVEDVPEAVRGRALVVKRLAMLPVECVVRGGISPSTASPIRTGTMWLSLGITGRSASRTAPTMRLPSPG